MMCFLMSKYDGMHGRNGTCRTFCQNLSNAAVESGFISEWMDHLSSCCPLYIHWSKYRGSKTLKKLTFDGNSARWINNNITKAYTCDAVHKGLLFDTIPQAAFDCIEEIGSMHSNVSMNYTLCLEDQQALDMWSLFEDIRAYATNLYFKFKPGAESRYVTTMSSKMTADIQICNQMHVAFSEMDMQRPERFNKFGKNVQRNSSPKSQYIKTDIRKITPTLKRPFTLSEFLLYAFLDMPYNEPLFKRVNDTID
eukprot:15174_1